MAPGKVGGHEEGVGAGPGEPSTQTLVSLHKDSMPLESVQSQMLWALHLRPAYLVLQSASVWHASFQLPEPLKSHSPVSSLQIRGVVQVLSRAHALPRVFPSASMQILDI